MADRILTWHMENPTAPGQIGAGFYAERGYAPFAVRLRAGTAPHAADAEFNILVDGVPLMNNRASNQVNATTGIVTPDTVATSVVLAKGETSETAAEDFAITQISEGSWITCELVADGNGRNITVQLELDDIADTDDAPEELD